MNQSDSASSGSKRLNFCQANWCQVSPLALVHCRRSSVLLVVVFVTVGLKWKRGKILPQQLIKRTTRVRYQGFFFQETTACGWSWSHVKQSWCGQLWPVRWENNPLALGQLNLAAAWVSWVHIFVQWLNCCSTLLNFRTGYNLHLKITTCLCI